MILKNKFYFYYLLAFLIGGMFLWQVSDAKAVGNAYFPQDTTIELNSVNYTITGGSDADEVTTSDRTITIKISPGQQIIFKSSDRKILNNDGGYSYDCSSTESSVTVTVSPGAAQKTVLITPDSSTCGGGGGGSGSNPTPTPTAGGGGGGSSGTPASPSSTSAPVPSSFSASPNLASYGLKEGDIVGASADGDPDIYIVNPHGYKRLFLNPIIFSFYGHLGGFSKVKKVGSNVRDVFQTSGLFRNCEANGQKVYGVEVSGEDTGILHWVNTTGAQAVADDADFFKKVFCINNNEFNWYRQGAPYTSVKQIPLYLRKGVVSTLVTPATVAGRLKVVSSVGWLNVRDQASLQGKILGTVLSNQEFNFVDAKDGWYKIQKDGQDFGWVFAKYVLKI